MLYRLEISEDAVDDLRQVYLKSNASGAVIEAILEELEAGNQGLLEILLEHGSVRREQPSFDIQKWVVLWDAGFELWRLKPFVRPLTPSQFRVIYAYVPSKRLYVVLGIVPRSFGYDPTNALSVRILRAYAELAS